MERLNLILWKDSKILIFIKFGTTENIADMVSKKIDEIYLLLNLIMDKSLEDIDDINMKQLSYYPKVINRSILVHQSAYIRYYKVYIDCTGDKKLLWNMKIYFRSDIKLHYNNILDKKIDYKIIVNCNSTNEKFEIDMGNDDHSSIECIKYATSFDDIEELIKSNFNYIEERLNKINKLIRPFSSVFFEDRDSIGRCDGNCFMFYSIGDEILRRAKINELN